MTKLKGSEVRIRIRNTNCYRMSDKLFGDNSNGEYVVQDEENGEKVEKDNIKYLIAVYRCTTNRYRYRRKIFSYIFHSLRYRLFPYIGTIRYHVHFLYTSVVDPRRFQC